MTTAPSGRAARGRALLAMAMALGLALGGAEAGVDGAARDAVPDGGGRDGGPRPAGAADAGARAGGDPDPDRELLEHLPEIEQLDLLRHLELFDPGDDDAR